MFEISLIMLSRDLVLLRQISTVFWGEIAARDIRGTDLDMEQNAEEAQRVIRT